MCGYILEGEEFHPGSILNTRHLFGVREKRGNGNSEEDELPSLYLSEGMAILKANVDHGRWRRT